MDQLYKKYEDDRKAVELENTKLKLKMVSRNQKNSSKASVDDYINNILGSGLRFNKPIHGSKVESQSATNINNNGAISNQGSLNQSCYFQPQNHSEPLPALPPLYEDVISCVKSPAGLFETQRIYEVFVSSGLCQEVLGGIWQQINRTSPGSLTRQELIAGLAMIALCQRQPPQAVRVPSWDQAVSLRDLPVPRIVCGGRPANDGLGDFDEWADFSTFAGQGQTGGQRSGPKENSSAVPSTATNGGATSDILWQIDQQFLDWQQRVATSPRINMPEVAPAPPDNDFGDFQIFSSAPSDHQSAAPAPNCRTDRYDLFTAETDPCDRLLAQWDRCLSQALRIVAGTVAVLRPLRDADPVVAREVFAAEKGTVMLNGIIEVYRVSRNIKLSASRANILTSSKPMLEHLSEMERCWTEFMLTMPEEMQIEVRTRLTRGIDSGACQTEDSSLCGVCLCRLDPEEGFLCHGLHRYHCPCANLWVNTLDLTLPGLTLPSVF